MILQHLSYILGSRNKNGTGHYPLSTNRYRYSYLRCNMRFLEKVPVKVEGMVQGSAEYVLIEIKSLFSIILTRLGPWGSTYCHSHSINAITIWLYGKSTEYINGRIRYLKPGRIKYTRRSDFHRIVTGPEGAWFLTFRGPWADTWQEERNGKMVTLTHGRKEIE